MISELKYITIRGGYCYFCEIQGGDFNNSKPVERPYNIRSLFIKSVNQPSNQH